MGDEHNHHCEFIPVSIRLLLCGCHYPDLLSKAPEGVEEKHVRRRLPTSLLALFLLAGLLPPWGGEATEVGWRGGSQQQGIAPGTYTITVTGTGGTLSHQAAKIILIVNR